MVRIPAKTGSSRQASFTLIEMMVVIAIIAILMALTAAAVVAVNKQAYNKSSQGTLDKLAPVMHKLSIAVLDQATKEPIPPAALAVVNGLSITSAGGVTDAARARAWWVKMRYKQAFPQTFAEAYTPVSIPPAVGVPTGFIMPGLPGYISFLSSKGISANSVSGLPQQTQQAENAICLLMALQRNASGVALTADTLGPSNIVEFPTNAQGVTLPGLADSWGMPLLFCRWPTQDNTLNPLTNPLFDPTVFPHGSPWNGYNDTQDPQGTLTATSWAQPGNPPYQIFQKVLHDLPPAPASPAQGQVWPLSFKLKPVIVSAGPDKFWTQYPPIPYSGPGAFWTTGGWGPGVDPRTLRQMSAAWQDNLDTVKGN